MLNLNPSSNDWSQVISDIFWHSKMVYVMKLVPTQLNIGSNPTKYWNKIDKITTNIYWIPTTYKSASAFTAIASFNSHNNISIL